MSNQISKIPTHLQDYIVDQSHASYTAIDHACWRFIMKISINFFSEHAHSSYLSGLDRTGITREKIPLISSIDKKLNTIGWKAVPVRGFLPPTIFMEFQSHSILPIASDMRTLEHLTYTPAPDIVHEAAGHSPIIIDASYSKYLSNYGKAAGKAIFSKYDHEVYKAIRDLSDIKENPDSTQKDINKSEEKLKEAIKNIPFISEAAYLARLNWWTVEYGLVGDIDKPKIFGAGLLSSVGESYNAINGGVKKIPLTLDCIKYPYDITEQQPQLFVASSFEHLSEVLHEFTKDMAYNKGGESALLKAIDSQSICTIELNNGLQISGMPVKSLGEKNTFFFKLNGPVQLCYNNIELTGHGGSYHLDGYSSPISDNRTNEKIVSESLGSHLDLMFLSGVKLSGKLEKKLIIDGTLQLASFSECTVRYKEEILFDPSWGSFDLSCGTSIISVFGGPADMSKFHRYLDIEIPNKSKPSYTTLHTDEFIQLNSIYEEIVSIRESLELSDTRLDEIIQRINSNHKNDWLVRYEIMEILSLLNMKNSRIYKDLKSQIFKISKSNQDLYQSILRGVEYIEN